MRSTGQLYGPPRVGGDALSYCTKCRMELAHVIVSMVDGKPVKVECKTCRGVHRYKLTAFAQSGGPRKSSSRVAAPRTVVRAAELWEQKLSQKKLGDAHPYLTTHRFEVGQVVNHPKFGAGLVEQLLSPTKMTVFFRDGEKILVHGLGGK